MARYIDADEFIKLIKQFYGNKAAKVQEYYDESINLIVKWPQDTLVHFVEKMRDKRGIEIVKCKDCKYYNSFDRPGKRGEYCGIKIWNDCHGMGYVLTNPDDFCSSGERKE